jgi:quinol monooxygenase YgiN
MNETVSETAGTVVAVAIHHPRPEHVDDWLDVMRQVGAQPPPGVVDIIGYRDQRVSNNLIAISRWESEEAMNTVLPAMETRSAELDQKWGERPTDVLVLRPIGA